ncbi:hypothetical protein PBRA_009047 [Plasmodiophora brassicae]|uniref:Uncharacterized protein n=1 Tax=Plasmodiophora brassicae TaxID=37360 RepID=A0A0G4J499_PLABS|nr:hypothetical protein PBRA_009047 [Plasmodiophora brassicae]
MFGRRTGVGVWPLARMTTVIVTLLCLALTSHHVAECTGALGMPSDVDDLPLTTSSRSSKEFTGALDMPDEVKDLPLTIPIRSSKEAVLDVIIKAIEALRSVAGPLTSVYGLKTSAYNMISVLVSNDTLNFLEDVRHLLAGMHGGTLNVLTSVRDHDQAVNDRNQYRQKVIKLRATLDECQRLNQAALLEAADIAVRDAKQANDTIRSLRRSLAALSDNNAALRLALDAARHDNEERNRTVAAYRKAVWASGIMGTAGAIASAGVAWQRLPPAAAPGVVIHVLLGVVAVCVVAGATTTVVLVRRIRRLRYTIKKLHNRFGVVEYDTSGRRRRRGRPLASDADIWKQIDAADTAQPAFPL